MVIVKKLEVNTIQVNACMHVICCSLFIFMFKCLVCSSSRRTSNLVEKQPSSEGAASVSLQHSQLTGIYSLLFPFLLLWPLHFTCRGLLAVELARARLPQSARPFPYPEPNITAAVARPSSDIRRLLNQHQLVCLWCTARQNTHIIQLFY